MPRKRSAQNRQDVLACLREGLSRRQAAARVGVSAATAVRWARAEGLSGPAPLRPAREAPAPTRMAKRQQERQALRAALADGLSRRRAAVALGLSVATAIRWAREFDDLGPIAPAPRRARTPRFRPDRESKRAELLAALATGLSKRQAAAKVGLPVATAIRWASAAGPRTSGPQALPTPSKT